MTLDKIVASLSEAQWNTLTTGKLSGRDPFKTLLALHRRGLVQRLSAHPGDNAWPPTELGLAVRDHIRRST